MAKNKIKYLTKLTNDQLDIELVSARKMLFENNFKHKMGQLKESHTLKEARRNIARIKTEIETNGG